MILKSFRDTIITGPGHCHCHSFMIIAQPYSTTVEYSSELQNSPNVCVCVCVCMKPTADLEQGHFPLSLSPQGYSE